MQVNNVTNIFKVPAAGGIYESRWIFLYRPIDNFFCFKLAPRFVKRHPYYNAGKVVQVLHNYPEPLMPDPDLFGQKRILVLGEFGGLGLPIENHTWQEKNNWGYQSFKTKEELLKRYSELMERIPRLISRGLSAAVYTQTTDVEVETNGIMTYDRREVKMPASRLKELHDQIYNNPQSKIAIR